MQEDKNTQTEAVTTLHVEKSPAEVSEDHIPGGEPTGRWQGLLGPTPGHAAIERNDRRIRAAPERRTQLHRPSQLGPIPGVHEVGQTYAKSSVMRDASASGRPSHRFSGGNRPHERAPSWARHLGCWS